MSIKSIKRAFCLVNIAVALLLISGCWSYRSLDEMIIVSGFTIDKEPDTGRYILVFETVDPNVPIKESGMQAKLIEGEGLTIFDAIRNAKHQIPHKLYFSNAQIAIISEEIAREDGVASVIDMFVRDAELRETMSIAVSKEETARDILLLSAEDTNVKMFDFQVLLSNDQMDTASTRNVMLYHIFDLLEEQSTQLVLPVIDCVEENDEVVIEVNGLSVFKDDKMIGYIDPDQAKYFLMLVDEIEGGVIPVENVGEKSAKVSLEIRDAKTKRSFEYEDEQLTITIEPELEVFIGEVNTDLDLSETSVTDEIVSTGEQTIKARMAKVVQMSQKEYKSDILGIGELISGHDPKLWETIEPNWDEIFSDANVEIKPKVILVNTAFTKNS